MQWLAGRPVTSTRHEDFTSSIPSDIWCGVVCNPSSMKYFTTQNGCPFKASQALPASLHALQVISRSFLYKQQKRTHSLSDKSGVFFAWPFKSAKKSEVFKVCTASVGIAMKKTWRWSCNGCSFSLSSAPCKICFAVQLFCSLLLQQIPQKPAINSLSATWGTLYLFYTFIQRRELWEEQVLITHFFSPVWEEKKRDVLCLLATLLLSHYFFQRRCEYKREDGDLRLHERLYSLSCMQLSEGKEKVS